MAHLIILSEKVLKILLLIEFGTTFTLLTNHDAVLLLPLYGQRVNITPIHSKIFHIYSLHATFCILVMIIRALPLTASITMLWFSLDQVHLLKDQMNKAKTSDFSKELIILCPVINSLFKEILLNLFG
jgi:hypothetical protein